MRKYLKFILLGAFAVFIFWFFGRNLNWTEVSESLRKASPGYLLLAGLIISLGYLLRAKRWQVLLEPITPTSLKELFATTTVGFTAVSLVGRAGEIVRPMWLSMRDKRVRPSAAIVTLGLERIFDLAALICFFAVNLLWLKPPPGHENDFDYVKLVGLGMLTVVAAGFAGLYVYLIISKRVIQWFSATGFSKNRVGRIVLSILKQLATSLSILRDWREFLTVVFWTLLLWFAIAVPTWMVLIAFDLPLGFPEALFVMGWAAVGSIVPTPGGAAGAFHAATAGGLIFLGISKEEAAAVSIAMHLVYFAPAIVFGIYYFFHGDISIERFRSLLSSENAVEEIESESPNT